MFDFGQKWRPASFDESGFTQTADLSVKITRNLHLTMLSGDISSGLQLLGVCSAPLGATAVAVEESYAIALARDRCIVVLQAPSGADKGWQSEGYAITDVTDGFTVIELRGLGLMRLLNKATTLDWALPTNSAAISFAGVGAAATFLGDRDAVRLMIETSLVPFVLLWIKAASAD